MPNLDDFTPWSVLFPAVLAAAAVLLSWRAARLSHAPWSGPALYWALGSAAVFLVAMSEAAVTNHAWTEAVAQANWNAKENADRLARTDAGVAVLKALVAQGSGNTEVLAAAAARIRAQQDTIGALQTQVQALRLTGRLDTHFYQDGKDAAVVGPFNYDKTRGALQFDQVTSPGAFDFSREVEFQKARIQCDRKDASPGSGTGQTYAQVMCHVLGPIQ